MNGFVKLRWALLMCLGAMVAQADELYQIDQVEPQPLLAAALRVDDALRHLGSALKADDSQKLRALSSGALIAETSVAIQNILDPYCLAMVNINPEARVKLLRGPAPAELIQQGWKTFLVKVHNQGMVTAELKAESPNADPVLHQSKGGANPAPEFQITPGELANRFLEIAMYKARPMQAALTGLPLEYAIVQIFTKETAQREARLSFNVGQGTQDIGYRNALNILFACQPSSKLVFRIKDDDGSPGMGSFIISDKIERLVADPAKAPYPADYRDASARTRFWNIAEQPVGVLTGLYPNPSRRLAETDEYPDFFFHPQVYRSDGEHVYLPAGAYEISYSRGPEYIPQTKYVVIPEGGKTVEETFQLKRWVNMAKLKWYSADHHVHAGGCSHYESPSAGVRPDSMFRQAVGEDLNIACVLTWGPCWYHQKTFFEGQVSELSTSKNLIRYDVEVSGFPSSHAGHVCLVRLKEDDYPETTKIEEWPSWTLPVLKWGKSQGGVVGYAHSGWGLEPVTPTTELPNYVMAKFDGIGANEYIVTTTQDAVDFISAGDTPPLWELNIWYHTLNCGFRTRISGETDFPCIFDERVGMARSYAKLDGKLDFDTYQNMVKQGRSYVSDGKSHIIDFTVDKAQLGMNESELRLKTPKKVSIKAKVAAYLPEQQDAVGAAIAKQSPTSKPYWDIERARVGTSRNVPVELIVNGKSVARQDIEASGKFSTVSFDYPIEQSSWVALRVLASSHTNPIFVLVGDKPVRASKKSANWCVAAVDKCWEQKNNLIREPDKADARAAYADAKAAYEQIAQECVVE